MNVTSFRWATRRTKHPSTIQVDVSGLVTILLEAVTLIGNTLPALTVFLIKKARNRTVTDYFVGALAVNDLFSVAIPLSLGIPTLLMGHWVGTKLGCQLYQVGIFWFQINAMLLVTCMSLDRYLALIKPVYYRRAVLRKIHRVKLLIGILCCTALVISSMPLMKLANNGIRVPFTYCPCIFISKASSVQEKIYPLFVLILGSSTLVIVFVCNFVVIKVLKDFKGRFSQRNQSYESSTCTAAMARKDRPSVVVFSKLVFVLGTLFYLTWTPVMVLLLLNQLEQEINEVTAVYAFSSLTINSLLHPLVYGIFSIQFRQSYWKIFRILVPCLSAQPPCGGHRRLSFYLGGVRHLPEHRWLKISAGRKRHMDHRISKRCMLRETLRLEKTHEVAP